VVGGHCCRLNGRHCAAAAALLFPHRPACLLLWQSQLGFCQAAGSRVHGATEQQGVHGATERARPAGCWGGLHACLLLPAISGPVWLLLGVTLFASSPHRDLTVGPWAHVWWAPICC
jgi:hypothetical protein